jgi:ribonuclease P protein component
VGEYSLRHSHRLSGTHQFSAIFKSGRRYKSNGFTILVRKNSLDYPRLGMAVAKRNIRLAVDRNRQKRLIRESFRSAKESLVGFDVVVMTGKTVHQLDNAQIFKSLNQLWQRIVAK